MADVKRKLGIYLSEQSLYYGVAEPDSGRSLLKIGSYDFSYDLDSLIEDGSQKQRDGLQEVIHNLQQKFNVGLARLVTHPKHECWANLPKLVKDTSDERNAHLEMLTGESDRSKMQLYWFDVSKQNYKFLVIRNSDIMSEYQYLTQSVPEVEFVSNFEIGRRWITHSGNRGSFLTISCRGSVISVASYMLGKLRAATYIQFDHIDDLPYLWSLNAKHLPWMLGFHEQIYLYGQHTQQTMNLLMPYLDSGAEIISMNSLQKIQVDADEKTYGFALELAYPAILLSLQA